MNNVDGAMTTNLAELIADVHRGGGSVIVDAAQAAPHALDRLRGLPADAFCFSAHKMYGASLGVVVAALHAAGLARGRPSSAAVRSPR